MFVMTFLHLGQLADILIHFIVVLKLCRIGTGENDLKKLCCLLLLLIPYLSTADTITLVADEWAPYNMKPGSKKPGYVVELAVSIFKQHGHEVKYKTINWSRAVKGVLDGEYDGAVGAAYGDCPEAVFPQEEVGIMQNTFFVLKNNLWKYDGVSSLAKIKIGIIQDYSYGNELDLYFNKNRNTTRVQESKGDFALVKSIKKALAGRIDVVIEDKAVFLSKLKEMELLDEFKIAGYIEPDRSSYLYISFSPKRAKSELYAKIYSDGIKEYRASGKLEQILNRYGLTDWK